MYLKIYALYYNILNFSSFGLAFQKESGLSAEQLAEADELAKKPRKPISRSSRAGLQVLMPALCCFLNPLVVPRRSYPSFPQEPC